MKEFWESQAKTFKGAVQAVNFDPLSDDIALDSLASVLNDNEVVCDIGCGNGRIALGLASRKKNTIFYGIDFAEEMINAANEKKMELLIENVHFYHIDSTSKKLADLFGNKFDKVISKRLLINIKGDLKHKTIENIHSILKNNGVYVMSECFIEPLLKINAIRKKINLEEITVKFFNEYLTLHFLDEIKEKFEVEGKIDYESTYYFISRIFNAYLSGGTPEYGSPINKLAIELGRMGVNPIEGYSPEVIYMLRKR